MRLLTAPTSTALSPLRSVRSRGSSAPYGLGFALFLLVNLVLFTRPTDFLPGLVGFELYQYVILVCLLVSFPAILQYLQEPHLEQKPIDLFVLLLLPAAFMSHIAQASLDQAISEAFAMFKIIIYYLLFVSLVSNGARLRAFTGWLVLFAALVALLGILDFHQQLGFLPNGKLPRLKNEFGIEAVEDITRMYGPGIFQDPNDIAALICSATMLLLGRLLDKRSGPIRYLWVFPLAGLGYGFYLSQSRGGMLAIAAGLAVLFTIRYGLQRGLLVSLLLAPLVVAFLAMRQADLSSHHDSGQTRIQLWNEGLVMFRANPVFGVGVNEYKTHAGQVAHNSYLHAFGEMGTFGGVPFFAAFYLALAGLIRLYRPIPQGTSKPLPPQILDEDFEQVGPYVFAALVTFMVSMFTLTLNYLVPTYAFLAMASVVLHRAPTVPRLTPMVFSLNLVVQMAIYSLIYLVLMFAMVRALFRA
ncbi:MAG: O-antigen ligase family protein [Gemmataceae bacterium]